MKHFFLFISLFFSISGFSQTCVVDSQYVGAAPGLYPVGPLGPTCELTASKTIVSLTDTLTPSPIGEILLYIDVMRVNAVTGLPAGLQLSTDVMASADLDGPYGYWFNEGTVPNQTSAIGCSFVYGTGGDWDAAVGGGPNNDGVYPLVFEVDARIHSTVPNVAALIPPGTWASGISPSLGGGAFFIYDTLVVPADYANISTVISGDTSVAPTTQYTYSVPMDASVTYDWTATNGNIISGQGTNEVVVEWAGSGNIEVDLTDGGCMGTDNLDVTAITTGIGDVAGLNVGVYPNPTNGVVTLRLENSGQVALRIMDVSGKTVLSEQLAGQTVYNVDMTVTPVGMYIMRVETADGITFKRLVRN